MLTFEQICACSTCSRFRGATSIHSLPAEILGIIFCALQDTEPLNPPPDSKVAHLTTTVTLVCKQWAHIIATTAYLWTRIFLPRHVPTLALRLTRAGKYPLDIFIGDFAEVDYRQMTWTLATLSDLHRIRTLTFSRLPGPYLSNLLNFITTHPSPAPLLQALTIAPNAGDADFTGPKLAALFDPAPCLRAVTLRGACLGLSSVGLFRSVTALTVMNDRTSRSTRALLAVLARCPLLEALTYCGAEPSTVFEFTTPAPVSLPRLATLDVTLPGCGFDALQYLVVPALAKLRLQGRAPQSSVLPPELAHFEERDDEGDESRVFESAATVAALLRAARTLTRVELVSLRTLPRAILDAFASPECCPHLGELVLDGCPVADAFFEDAVSHHPTLRSLEIRNSDISEEIIRAWLSSVLKQRGINSWKASGFNGWISGGSEPLGIALTARGCPNMMAQRTEEFDGMMVINVDSLG